VTPVSTEKPEQNRSDRPGASSTREPAERINRGAATSFHIRLSIPRLALLSLVFLLAACDNRTAGVISTGNAGRISGKVVADGQGVAVQVRLIRVDTVRAFPNDSTRSDDTGAFYFPSVPSGDYRVEAWQNGYLAGKSAQFHLDGDKTGLLIVLVPLAQIKLDLSSLGKVDSVFLDNPDNPGVQTGNIWTIRALKDSTGVLYTLVEQASGAAKWMAWDLQWVNGTVVIRGATDGSIAPFFHSVDTSAFFLSPHTVALWTFDSLTQGHKVLDQGPNHLDLTLPVGAGLVSSPHGKALDALTLLPNSPVATTATTTDGSLPIALQWGATGMQTIEMRFKVDSAPTLGYVLLGSYVGPQVGLSTGRAIVVSVQCSVDSKTQWQNIVTLPGVVPLGRWVNLAVSIDRSREQIYVWIDGAPMETFSYGAVIAAPNYVNSTIPPFCVGGASWDARVGAFQVDEVRISDTLVYGYGSPLQPDFVVNMGGNGAVDAGVSFPASGMGSQDSTSAQVLVGALGSGNVGRYLWRASIPPELAGRSIIYAELRPWSAAAPSASKEFQVHQILQSWAAGSLGSSPIAGSGALDDHWVQASPASYGMLQAPSRGGVLFDVTPLVQSWVSDTASNHGILLRAFDESAPGVEMATTKSDTLSLNRRPSIIVYYR
jgi:hypothetical protein